MAKGSSKLGGFGGNEVSDNEKVNKTLNQIIKRTRDLKKEQYRIVDEEGNVVLAKQGKEGSVVATVGEIREFLDGATSIHNHPNEYMAGTFSYDDVRDFGYGAKSIVATGKEGSYVLTNKKWGTKDERSTWIDLQNQMEKIQNQNDYLTVRKKAQEKLKNSPEKKQMDRLNAEFLKRKNAGENVSDMKDLYDRYTKVETKYKTKLKLAERKEVVEPTHNWLKKNANKYGFEYKFIPRR